MDSIGNILSNNRKSKKMTLKELASLSGVGPSTISDIETGKAKHPRMDTLEKLAKALDISVGVFFDCDVSSNYSEINAPKEYTDKFKVTSRDKRDFKKFWDAELITLNKMSDLSKNDIESIHNALMYAFWSIKARNKEKYTPRIYKNNIYINQKL